MKSSKSCRQCKFYDTYEEFNCRKFKIVILDFNNAVKCKYIISIKEGGSVVIAVCI
ncbi:hypothetical protein [Clostridium tepidum]|uniref:hypothetical protein n=1 Tax=Clostridium tepidum TaxID=1962263 RepID=UPI00190EAA98|nr:hypothetical protein [Clostridium tepidum]